MFILRLIRNLFVLLCVAIPMEILGWFILPWVLLFVPNTQYKLPALFRWWDNADIYIGRDLSTYEAVCAQGYWARLAWLAWRNPANYFGYTVLSFQFNARGEYLVCNPKQFDVGNTTGAHAGYRYMLYEQKSPTGGEDEYYYEYCWIHKWSSTKCLRIRIGWKIENNFNPVGSYCQWCCVIQPFIDYSGV